MDTERKININRNNACDSDESVKKEQLEGVTFHFITLIKAAVKESRLNEEVKQ